MTDANPGDVTIEMAGKHHVCRRFVGLGRVATKNDGE